VPKAAQRREALISKALFHAGSFCVRFRRPVVAVWTVLAVGLTMATNVAGPTTNNEVTLPGTDSQAAFDLLASECPPQRAITQPPASSAPTARTPSCRSC
jgi:hypothetical protein